MPGLIDFFAPETDGFSITIPGSLTKRISTKSKRAQWIMMFVLFNPFVYSLFLFRPYLSKENQELLFYSWYQTYALLRSRIPLIGLCGIAGLIFLSLSVRFKSISLFIISLFFFLSAVVGVSFALYSFLII